MKDKFDCEVGLSDHTLGNTSAILSISFGAKLIEKHFTYRRSDGVQMLNFQWSLTN